MIKRCVWCQDDPLYVVYHDQEWGKPVRDDKLQFEFLILEGMQAGLSWLTVLKKRENFRQAFDHFDANKIARYSEARLNKLFNNAGIIRNRLKIQAAVKNAKAFLAIQNKFGSFSDYIWQFVDGEPIQNKWKRHQDVPATSKQSDVMSKALKKLGFSFVGSTICYAHMQATGMVNDHLVSCFRYRELAV